MRVSLIKLLLAMTAVFAPVQGMITACFVLIAVDLITGLTAARKQKLPITSSGLRRTLVKLFVYEAAIMLGFVAQQYLTGPSIPITNIIGGYVGLTELLSSIENLNVISGTDLLKALLEKLNQTKQ